MTFIVARVSEYGKTIQVSRPKVSTGKTSVVAQYQFVLRVIPILLFCLGLFLPGSAVAANCGGAVVCACGDTVTQSTTLSADLTCAGDGLTIGANSITIDGGGHTLTGNNTDLVGNSSSGYGIQKSSSYSGFTIQNITITNFKAGIYNNGASNVTIQNVTATGNGLYGIFIQNASNVIVTGNTANNNFGYGIYLNGVTGSTISNNTTNSNSGDINSGNPNGGIYLNFFSNGNTISNNTSNSNSQYGIYLFLSTGNTFTGNTMSGNHIGNLSALVSGSYSNTIDTSNLVEGKPVYFLANQTDQTYDGDLIGEIGMFWCTSCSNVVLRDATLSANNQYGVLLASNTGSTVQNVTITNNMYGIYVTSSTASQITGNTVRASPYPGSAITSVGGSANTVSGNTVSSSDTALSITSTDIVTNNTLLYNKTPLIGTPATNTDNKIYYPITLSDRMIQITETARIKNLNDTVNFTANLFDANGTDCTTCIYTAVTYPQEAVTNSMVGNTVTGSFTVTKVGTYSLVLTVTDAIGNTSKRNFLFFVNAEGSATQRYYLRSTSAVEGPPRGNGFDSQGMLFSAPVSTEAWYCSGWVQSSPDAPHGNYPLASISVASSTYTYAIASTPAYMGIQRFTTYGAPINSTNADATTTLPVAENYVQTSSSFSDLSWAMDFPRTWAWPSVKWGANNTNFYTHVQSSSAQPSMVDYTYTYTTTPAVKSSSNQDLPILSATAPNGSTSDATIVIDNPTAAATSTNIVLPGIQRPFTNATSTIGSDATTTLTALISGNTTSSIAAVPLDLVPSSGSLDVTITTWNTSGTEQKTWAESGTVSDATSAHTISGLTTGETYVLRIDGIVVNSYTADQSGSISFTYSGGYSTHTFDLTRDVTSPAAFNLSSPADGAQASQNPSVAWAASSDTESGLAKYQLFVDGALSVDNISTTSAVIPASCGSHTWFVRALDNAGNQTDSATRGILILCGGGAAVGSPATPSQTASAQSTTTASAPIPESLAPTTNASSPTVSASGARLSEGQVQSVLSLLKAFGVDQATIDNVTAALRGTSATSNFSRDLTIGIRGEDVKALQKYLNSQGFLITDSGPGSPGNETNLFGLLTRSALSKLQKERGISPAVGYFGPKTRASLGY